MLEDFLAWIPEHFLDGQEIKITYRAYVSQMVVNSKATPLKFLESLNAIGERKAKARMDYGQSAASYRATSFRMGADPDDNKSVRAPDFVFERRVGASFAEELYFTSAPVNTSDHWLLLSALEKLIA
jgi:hypothetical protein